MTLTIKFSQMTAGGDLPNNSSTPGLLGGSNVLFNNPWTFLAPGPTGSRPPPSSSINYRLRLNTDTQTYEYYDAFVSMWVQLSGSGTGTINPGITNDLAFYPANGTTLSPIAAAASSVLVTSAGSVPSLSNTLPSGLSIPGATITSSTAALTAGSVVAAPVAGSDIVNKTYADGLYTASVHSIIGSTDQVLANGTVGTPQTGVVTLTLPQSIGTGNSPTFSALTLSSTNIHGVLIGEGPGAIVSVAPSATSGVPLISQGSTTDPAYGTAVVAGGGTGNTTFTAYSVICAGTTATGVFQNVSGLGTSGYVLTSNGAGALPTWQAVSASGAIETINGDAGSVTPTAGSVTISGGSTGLTTSGSSSTLSIVGTLALASGGTNANLTANNGGIFYSTASAGAILAGTATARQMLQSGASTTPAWSTSTYPATNAANTLLYASSANVMAALATANDGVLITSNAGVPSWLANSGTPGFVLTANSGAPPSWQVIPANVSSISGTANQITASASTGAVTLAIASNPILPGTGGVTLPTGNTAARAGGAGTMRFNSQTNVFEVTVDGTNWTTVETSATGVLSVSGTLNRITSTGGTTPVIDISASYVGQSSITTLGTITTGVWTGTNIALANGGTNASLTASNGGIFYSTASAGAILAGTATANQLLLSGSSTTPAWSTSTYPATNAANTLLYASAANVMSALATANSSVLVTSAGGVPSLSTTLPNINIGTPSAGVATNITATGGLRSRQIFTTGTAATYTKPANVTSILVEVWGAGGGGGGSLGTASQSSSGAGGGAGGYAQLYIASASGTYTYTVGAAGTAGSSGNNAGGTGGTTSFGASLQATGGTGGTGGASFGAGGGDTVGVTGGTGSNGDINSTGAPGGSSVIANGVSGVGLFGAGGSSTVGGGGVTSAVGAGNAGGRAAGGSGGLSNSSSAAGGAGGSGLIVVSEFS
jgi:hypothetical protein